MSVLLEAITVVVRNDAVDRSVPGGVATTPPGSVCTYPLSSLTPEERRGLV